MIKIKIADLKDFLRKSRCVKTNNVMPVLSMIKLECSFDGSTLTKTNLNTYCRQSVNVDFQKETIILLDERLISALLGASSQETLFIDVKANDVIISDGFSQISFQLEDALNFPNFPEVEDDKKEFNLTAEVIEAINSARAFVKKDALETSLSFVHVGGKDVFACSGTVLYHKTFDTELPTLMLYAECCAAVGEFESATYYTAGNYDFFDVGSTIYGFIKTQTRPVDHKQYTTRIIKGEGYSIEKNCIERFCELTIKSSVLPNPKATITDGGINRLIFEFKDDAYQTSTKMEFEVKGKNLPIPEFSFNPNLILPALKAIPYSSLHLTPSEGLGYIITTEEDKTFGGIAVPQQ